MVTQQVSHWHPAAVAAMRLAGASDGDLQVWREQLDKQIVQLWRISGEAEGWLLTRLETMPEGHDELVLLAAAGTNARPVIRWAAELAKANGIDSVRTHITRPGLQRMYEAAGYHLAERVMRLKTNG